MAIADRNPILGNEELADDPFAELHLGEKYQNNIHHYDIIIKSPGVKIDESTLFHDQKVTSQTDLFLQYYRDQTIGVTGTKGKSTSASLIHHFLTKAKKKSVLIGNIGRPPFEGIKDIDDDTTVVFELSAHQLESIHVSPHISVLLNIFHG